MFGEAYIVLVAVLLPYFDWQQKYDGRNYISMMITSLFMILWIATGTLPFVLDLTTYAVIAFSIWMIGSMFWTTSRASGLDVYTLLTGLCVFLVARSLPMPDLLPALMMVGIGFALPSIYYRKSINQKEKFFLLGNPNHTANVMMLSVFVCLWLTFNSSLFFAGFLIPLIWAIVLTQCRGAQIGLLSGLFFIACTQSLYYLILIPFILVAAFFVIKQRDFNAAKIRLCLWLAAVMLVKTRLLAGGGMRSFRKDYPVILPHVYKHPIFAKIKPDDFTSISANTPIAERMKSHRVHNDHLELLVELGLIGYLLFIGIFFTFSYATNPLLSGAIVAFAVHGLFFFPLREAHTALPFFAILGAVTPAAASQVVINPFIALALILLIAKLAFDTLTKIFGLSYWDAANRIQSLPVVHTEDEKRHLARKQHYLDLAIQKDPYNGMYLTHGYYYNIFNNPKTAFLYASRCLENYDGGAVKWGCFDQYARAIMACGGFGVAKMALNAALTTCPGFEQSEALMKTIEDMEGQASGIKRRSI
jgi:hypothetical protein